MREPGIGRSDPKRKRPSVCPLYPDRNLSDVPPACYSFVSILLTIRGQ